MGSDTTTTALAIPEKWRADIEGYEQKKYNILAPRELGEVPPMHTPRMSVVQINPDEKDGGDIYPLPGSKYGLTKVALDRISQAAGISWLPELCGRVDDGRDPNIVRYKAVGRVRDLSGVWRTIIGEKEIDLVAVEDELREGVPSRTWIKDIKDPDRKAKAIEDAVVKEMIQFRKHKVGRAQSGAMNRAIRSALALKSGYSKEEISRPFVIPKVVFTPDYNDPEVKRFMLADATGHVAELYGSPAAIATIPLHPALPPAAEDDAPDRPALPPADSAAPQDAGTTTSASSLPAETGKGPEVAAGQQTGLPLQEQEREPDPDEMRFFTAFESEQAAGTAEVRQACVTEQIRVLEKLIKRKGYNPTRLKKPLAQFTRDERKGFAAMLLKMADRPGYTDDEKNPWD